MSEESETVEVSAEEVLRQLARGIAFYQGLAPDVDDNDRRQWWLHRRVLPDGRVLHLTPMLFGNLQLGLSQDAETQCFDGIWCYHDSDAAWRAVLGWNGHGDPEGWYRHNPTARRRPDGTPESEYVEP
jgi:hypothetical protein